MLWTEVKKKKARELCKDEINKLSRHYARKVGESKLCEKKKKDRVVDGWTEVRKV